MSCLYATENNLVLKEKLVMLEGEKNMLEIFTGENCLWYSSGELTFSKSTQFHYSDMNKDKVQGTVVNRSSFLNACIF
jgi:hypothetical protein